MPGPYHSALVGARHGLALAPRAPPPDRGRNHAVTATSRTVDSDRVHSMRESFPDRRPRGSTDYKMVRAAARRIWPSAFVPGFLQNELGTRRLPVDGVIPAIARIVGETGKGYAKLHTCAGQSTIELRRVPYGRAPPLVLRHNRRAGNRKGRLGPTRASGVCRQPGSPANLNLMRRT